MSKVVSLPTSNPLLGTWGSLDDAGTTVEYTIAQGASGLTVAARDTYDGEIGLVSNVEYDGSVLAFVVRWSTGRICLCQVRPGTRNQIQFSFTYTEHEHLSRRTT